MRSVVLGSLRRYGRRYVAAAVAVMVAVAFLVVTNALISATRSGLTAEVGVPYAGADAVVQDPSGELAAALVERAERKDAQAAVLGWTTQPIRRDGRLVAERADVAPVAGDSGLRWQELAAGRFPTGAGEAVADVNAAKTHGVAIGDHLTVGSGRDQLEVTVVGMVNSPSILVAGSLYLTWPDIKRWAQQMYVDSVAWAGAGAVADQVTALQRAFPDASVVDRDTHVAERKVEVDRGVDVMAILALLFVAIAVFVAVLVIANTFTILFAQRARDLALLRCVGATRKQLVRSVRLEALLIGVGASLLGLAVGAGLGHGLVALINGVTDSFSLGAAALSPGWLLGALLTGVLTTLVAAWLPTRRVVRVSPLQALRPESTVTADRRAGVARMALALSLLVVGVAGLTVAVTESSMELMVVGGAATFTGVLVLGPVIVPAAVSLIGGLAGRIGGPTWRLATRNTVRNPRRTAATAAALLIGVTLTSAVLTGLATSRGAIDAEMDTEYPIDVALTATTAHLDANLLDAVRGHRDVDEVVTVNGTTARADTWGPVRLGVADPSVAHDREALNTTPGTVVAPSGLLTDAEVPRKVTFTVGDRSITLAVQVGDGWGDLVLIHPADLAALTDAPTTQAIWLRASSSADAEDLVGDLTALTSDVDVTSTLSQRAYVDLQLNVVTAAVAGLLGISVLIALVGIGNTLGLSVVERSREHAMLRATGLTRRQLRGSLLAEASLLSVVATVLGIALGLTFAWVAVQTAVEPIAEGVTMVLPWGQLGTVVAVSALAGVVSAVLPARRAARATPAAGLAAD